MRTEPLGWTRTYTAQQTIDLLKTGQVTDLSLDHDLGIGNSRIISGPRTGYDVLLWMEEAVVTHGFSPPERIHIHSANTAAVPRMKAAVDSIRRKSRLHNDS